MDPYCILMIRIPAALAALAATAVALVFGAPRSEPSERIIMTGNAAGLELGPVSSAWAAEIPAPTKDVPPATMPSKAAFASTASVVNCWSTLPNAEKEAAPLGLILQTFVQHLRGYGRRRHWLRDQR